jgi:hypothetical protein
MSHLRGEFLQVQMWDWLENEPLARGVRASLNVGLVGKLSHLRGKFVQVQMWDWLENEPLARGVRASPNVGLIGK